MNISLQNVDKVSALLTVNIEKADYQEKVEKVLKTYRQKANIPGFRKGMVPMSLIKKQFGKAVLAEEVDKLMQEKVNEYIHENKVNMLGMPLPNAEKMQPVDFDTQENFEFVFDIALAPEFNSAGTMRVISSTWKLKLPLTSATSSFLIFNNEDSSASLLSNAVAGLNTKTSLTLAPLKIAFWSSFFM